MALSLAASNNALLCAFLSSIREGRVLFFTGVVYKKKEASFIVFDMFWTGHGRYIKLLTDNDDEMRNPPTLKFTRPLENKYPIGSSSKGLIAVILFYASCAISAEVKKDQLMTLVVESPQRANVTSATRRKGASTPTLISEWLKAYM